jgi:hypothetical protein
MNTGPPLDTFGMAVGPVMAILAAEIEAHTAGPNKCQAVCDIEAGTCR